MKEIKNKTSGKGNNLAKLTPVKEDWEHDLDIREYKLPRKSFQELEAAWK